MCGFAGFLDTEPQLTNHAMADLVGRMAEALRARGPDDGGTWTDAEAGIAFGFRRLAILDLTAAGHQPMVSADGRYVLVFNGEAYNFAALREELEGRGIAFRGGSDTEVVLEAFAHWGFLPTLRRLNGMFALALWDRAQRTLSLARDRLGIKPLYLAQMGASWLFASQPGAFVPHPGWSPRLDRGALKAFFRFNYVPAPATIWRNVEKLVPGGWAVIRPDRGIVRGRYWSAREEAARPVLSGIDARVGSQMLEALLADAVRLQMVADVPVGAFLSGGVDSSTVVALMQSLAGERRIRTFTIGFPVRAYDESAAAAAVARHLGTEHTEMIVTPEDAMSVVPFMADIYDEPFADASQIPTFLVSRLTRQSVKVALSGDGGDEGFAGYNRYDALPRWQKMSAIPLGMRSLAARAVRSLAPRHWDRLLGSFGLRTPQAGDKLHKAAHIATAGTVEELYRRLVSQWQDPGALVRDAPDLPHPADDRDLPQAIPDPVQRLQYLDFVTYLPDDILTKVDRASMAVGLEARVPLLDHRVVEFALRLPDALKRRDGRGKYLLRQVLYRHVPRNLVDRPKSGFAMPIGAWLRGPLRDWAEDLLDPRLLRADGLLDAATIRAAWTEHLSGARNLQYQLWGVLMFQCWRRRWRLLV
ncbi:MAG: asparagine synthase (glutamine-hydrolyzing) [Rhodospirillales bacterium]|jgi:asparagine synthase (glutamine-hydrolysing)